MHLLSYFHSGSSSPAPHCTDCTTGGIFSLTSLLHNILAIAHSQKDQGEIDGEYRNLATSATVGQKRSQRVSMFPGVVCNLDHPPHSAATVIPTQGFHRVTATVAPNPADQDVCSSGFWSPRMRDGSKVGDEERERPILSKETGSSPRQQESP